MKASKLPFAAIIAMSASFGFAQTSDPYDTDSIVDEDEYVSEEVWALAATSTEMTLCANEPVPSGWVVYKITAGCGTSVSLHYLRKLDPNGGEQTMCNVTAVPQGWIVTNILGGCLSGISNYVIRYAQKGFTYNMCRVPGSFIPEGWVAKSIATGCGLPGYQYWTISWPDPAYSPMEVCNVAPVPAGWLKTGARAGCYSSNGLITIKYMP